MTVTVYHRTIPHVRSSEMRRASPTPVTATPVRVGACWLPSRGACRRCRANEIPIVKLWSANEARIKRLVNEGQLVRKRGS